MLSDHEREAWRELERQFITEQGRATTDGPSSRVGRRQLGAPATLLIMTMGFVAVMMMMAGSLMGVLISVARPG